MRHWLKIAIVAVVSIVVIGYAVTPSRLPPPSADYGFGLRWACSSILRVPICFEDQGEARPPLQSD